MRGYGKNGKVMAVALVIVSLLAVGFLAKMEGLALWQRQPDLFFLVDPVRPVMIGADSYYYMDLARDLLQKNYQPEDPQRCFPAGTSRPWPPPFLSAFLAGLALLLPFPLEWIAAVMPAVLGLLLFWPLYLLGRQVSGGAAGWIAATTGICWPVYVARTVFGRFDTDCLNVVFATGAVYLALRVVAEENKRKKSVWIAAGTGLYGLFLWWWPQVPLEVSGLALFPLAVALALSFGGRIPARMMFSWIVIGLIIGGFILLTAGGEIVDATIRRAVHVLEIPHESVFPFPPMFSGDQQANPPLAWSYLGGGGLLVLVLGLAGLVRLFANRPRLIPFFLPLLLVSGVSFFALRFLFFATPLVGLGLGYGFQRLGNMAVLQGRRRYGLIVALGLVLFLCFPAIHRNNRREPWLTAWHYAAMQNIGRVTEHDAVIWSSYSKGYPLQFYARRATIADGSFRNGRILYIQNYPLAVDSFRLAANWMQFYAAHGMAGVEQVYRLSGRQWPAAVNRLEKLLAAGPEGAAIILRQEGSRDDESIRRFVRFLFPGQSLPLYLFIDVRQFQESWYQAGAWDLAARRAPSPVLKQYEGVHEDPAGMIAGAYPYGEDAIRIDPVSGRFHNRAGSGRLTHLLQHPSAGAAIRTYPHSRGYRFEMVPGTGLGVLLDGQVARTVFNRLMIRRQYDERFFQPVLWERCRYQLWQVKGEAAE